MVASFRVFFGRTSNTSQKSHHVLLLHHMAHFRVESTCLFREFLKKVFKCRGTASNAQRQECPRATFFLTAQYNKLTKVSYCRYKNLTINFPMVEPIEVMHIDATKIHGCCIILPRVLSDERGMFIKTYHDEMFSRHGLNTEWKEEYYSVSHNNVLRGLHFQMPPHDHEKLVYITSGRVLDVVVDLRKASPTYGQHVITELSAENNNMLYIPRGCAHGFYVSSGIAVMHYKVSSVYAPTHDTGILWNSAGIAWPNTNPLISPRDGSFPRMQDFVSPF